MGIERKEVYLDNSATTRVFDSVRDVMVQAMMADYGNTSSRHMKGVEAENYIKSAREEIAKSLKVKDKEIIGFACFEATAKNYFGPIGVAPDCREGGVGTGLLLSCLHSMWEMG